MANKDRNRSPAVQLLGAEALQLPSHPALAGAQVIGELTPQHGVSGYGRATTSRNEAYHAEVAWSPAARGFGPAFGGAPGTPSPTPICFITHKIIKTVIYVDIEMGMADGSWSTGPSTWTGARLTSERTGYLPDAGTRSP